MQERVNQHEDCPEDCPYRMLELAFAANGKLIATCEELIERNETHRQEYNKIVDYANTIAKLAEKWKKKAEAADDRNRQLIQGLEMACKAVAKRDGVKSPLYFQLQGFLTNGI